MPNGRKGARPCGNKAGRVLLLIDPRRSSSSGGRNGSRIMETATQWAFFFGALTLASWIAGRPCGRPWKCRARPPTKSDRISDIRTERRRLRLGSRHGGGFGDPLTLIAPMPVDRNLPPSCAFSGGRRSAPQRVADGGRRRPGCGLLPWRDRVPRRLRAGDWPGKGQCPQPI